MRSHPIRILSSLALATTLSCWLLGASAGRAVGSPLPAITPALSIDDPGPLAVGTHAELVLRLRTAPRQDHPLLLTPSVEGVAVESVRGRLLRPDGRSEQTGELSFVLPLQVREPGTAIVRVEALTYHCDSRCVPVRVHASRTLVIH